MTPSPTLTEILSNYKNVARSHESAMNQDQAKQAILQWVADEVVGKNILVVDVTLKDNYVKKDAKNDLKDEQRQILKDHGWKPSDKEES